MVCQQVYARNACNTDYSVAHAGVNDAKTCCNCAAKHKGSLVVWSSKLCQSSFKRILMIKLQELK